MKGRAGTAMCDEQSEGANRDEEDDDQGRENGIHSKTTTREVTERTGRGHDEHTRNANDHQCSAMPFFQNG